MTSHRKAASLPEDLLSPEVNVQGSLGIKAVWLPGDLLNLEARGLRRRDTRAVPPVASGMISWEDIIAVILLFKSTV
jgi:hypothetical protein